MIVARKLREIIDTINRTSENGMWLDGLYMAGPYLIKYANQFHEKDLIQFVLYQEHLMHKHMTEEDGEALRVKGICIGTSTGTYDYYVDRPTSTDDLHGVGAFLFAMMALYDYVK